MAEKKRQKVHSLTGRIDMARMHEAFKKVKSNQGAPGVDGVTIRMFEANLEQNLAALMYDLKHRGHYHSQPLLRVYIPKGKGKTRALGIPTVRDRVAQEVIRSLLEPIFEPTFAEESYGFRPGRNAHQAIEAVLDAYINDNRYVVDADILSFFDNIPHELIIDLVAERVADGNILQILREFLTAEVVEDDGEAYPPDRGTPQGGVISPLLANIVLDVMDQRLIQAGFRLVRYADDFVVLCPDPSSAEQALALANETLHTLGLSLSPEKTRVVTFLDGVPFLGFYLSRRAVSIRQKSIEKFKDRIRSLTIRSHNLDQEVIRDLNRVIAGFAQYFATPFSDVKTQFMHLDTWTRVRLRCMKFKRISRGDNRRLRNKHLARMGLVPLCSFVQKQ